MQKQKKSSPLLNRLREAIRVRHYSIRTEQAMWNGRAKGARLKLFF